MDYIHPLSIFFYWQQTVQIQMITIVNFVDYVPDSDPNSDSNPDSDITVSAVNSDDISDFGDETGESGIGGEHGDQQAEWTQNFGVDQC